MNVLYKTYKFKPASKLTMGVLNADFTNTLEISLSYLFRACALDSLRSPTKKAMIAPVEVPTIMSNASHTSIPPIALTY